MRPAPGGTAPISQCLLTVSWTFLRDMPVREVSGFTGAPEEIRAPDPQIRSSELNDLFLVEVGATFVVQPDP